MHTIQNAQVHSFERGVRINLLEEIIVTPAQHALSSISFEFTLYLQPYVNNAVKKREVSRSG